MRQSGAKAMLQLTNTNGIEDWRIGYFTIHVDAEPRKSSPAGRVKGL